MGDKEIIRRISQLAITHDDDQGAYLVSVFWRRVDKQPTSQTARVDYFMVDEDDLLDFATNFTKTKIRIDEQLRKQKADGTRISRD